MKYNQIEQFCTPAIQEETDFDRRAFTDAQNIDIEFENRILRGYSLGMGKKVLLVHGWSSRASHMSLLARFLVKNNFHVIAFDMPAHGSSRDKKLHVDTSSMFEFGRAISCIVRKLGDIYAILGHSLGAIAAGFTMAGTGLYADYRITAEKLILISAPESLARIIESYCQKRNEKNLIPELTQSLENAFNIRVCDYNLVTAINSLQAMMLVVHDKEDEDIPVNDALRLNEANDRSRLFLTTGYGHKRILLNREVFRAVGSFLATMDFAGRKSKW